MIRHLLTLFLAIAALAANAQTDSIAHLVPSSKITRDTLPNGLQSIVLKHHRPGGRANFYLVLKTGTAVEDSTQYGMAHFLEHMAFNGSKNFPDKSFVDYAQANGVAFGGDLNAYTDFNETVFSVSYVDTHRKAFTDSVLVFFKDVLCNLNLTPQSIDAERKIILEEFNHSFNATQRIVYARLAKLYTEQSPYSGHHILGSRHSLEKLDSAGLRQFYSQWYRPELAAIIVIGDVNPQKMSRKIAKIFGEIPPADLPTVRTYSPTPMPGNLRAFTIVEPEIGYSTFKLFFKQPAAPRHMRSSVEHYVEATLQMCLSDILEMRLSRRLNQDPDSPWLEASSRYGKFELSKDVDAWEISCMFNPENRDKAIHDILEEVKSMQTYGVSDDEARYAAQSMATTGDTVERYADEMASSEYFQLVLEYFANDEILPETADESHMLLGLSEIIDKDLLNVCVQHMLSTEDIDAVLMTNDPADAPADSLLQQHIEHTFAGIVPKASNDRLIFDEPVIADSLLPKASRLRHRTYDFNYDAYTYTYGNGARVIVRPVDVVSDQIDVLAVRPGGFSAHTPPFTPELYYADRIGDLGGIASMSVEDLKTRFGNTFLDIYTQFNDYSDCVSGTCAVAELDDLLALMHLRLTTAPTDSTAFRKFVKQMVMACETKRANPTQLFTDSVTVARFGHNHPIMRVFEAEDFEHLDYGRGMEIYRNHLANPAAFTFIITGNIDPDSIQPAVAKYIGSLPKIDKKAKYSTTALNTKILPGHRTIRFEQKMQQPSDMVYIEYQATAPCNIDLDCALNVLQLIVQDRCRQTIRAQYGASYSIHVDCDAYKIEDYISLMFTFSVNPDMTDRMIATVSDILRDIAQNGPEESAYNNFSQYYADECHTMSLQQSAPLTQLNNKVVFGDDDVLNMSIATQRLTPADVQDVARMLIDSDRSVTVLMHGVEQ